ncbi:hypothetical protein QBC39DRAFT_259865 [Podospora conica]|nr:hypothetical protein QBC39DRAFT_259865 [Schizothecium conicum]
MPSSPPPSYEQALRTPGPHDTRPTAAAAAPTTTHPSSLLDVPDQPTRNGIPLHARRSMEDELRPLPPGWVRTYDPETEHQFFVDTRRDPPRSIWVHPYDDDEYLASLPAEERARVKHVRVRPSTPDAAMHDTTDEEHEHDAAPQQPKRKLGRKLKDTITGTTHEQRARERAEREAREREAYAQHQRFRRGMQESARTGRPQFIGTDKSGDDVYLEPAGRGFPGVAAVRRLGPYLEEVQYRSGMTPGPPGRYVRPAGDMYGMQQPGFGFARPGLVYGRPRGYGYGGGMGMPLAMPLFGGMMLGGLAGSAMF